MHGGGSPVGMLADMLCSGMNMNCGGRDHVGYVNCSHILSKSISEFFSSCIFDQNCNGAANCGLGQRVV